MRKATTLEARLAEWGKEYGGGRHENIGWLGISPIATLMKYHGRAPQGLNPSRLEVNGSADEVEHAVRALQAQDKGYVPACVLRCEYMATSYTREEKIRSVRKVGASMDNSRYSQHLRMAKIHVAAWLRIPFDEPLDEGERVAMMEYLIAC
ncbi:hypothetical protein [Dyella japonica]|uniref:Uncharacterized protein n=1 Tax=Dyella japonica TaxID=231455 RepID=A0ABV2JZ27_9GAMM